MTMTPVSIETASSSATAQSLNTASFTPTANSLIIVFALFTHAYSSARGPFTALSSTFSPALTWTEQAQVEKLGTSRGAIAGVWTTQTGSSPGSGTVTATLTSSSANRLVIEVFEITSDFNTSTPIKQAKSIADIADPIVVTLDSAPDADSVVIAGGAFRNVTSVTKDDAYTELTQLTPGSAMVSEVQYDNTSADTTAQWSGTSTDAAIGPSAALALEVDAASTTDPTPSLSQAITISESVSVSIVAFDTRTISQAQAITLTELITVSLFLKLDITLSDARTYSVSNSDAAVHSIALADINRT